MSTPRLTLYPPITVGWDKRQRGWTFIGADGKPHLVPGEIVIGIDTTLFPRRGAGFLRIDQPIVILTGPEQHEVHPAANVEAPTIGVGA